MGRLVAILAIGAVVAVVVWRSNALSSLGLGPAATPPPGPDAGSLMVQSADSMTALKSAHVVLSGSRADVDFSGTADLTFPHTEMLTVQLRTGNQVVPVSERVQDGRVQVQVSGAPWKDVTGAPAGQFAPGLDPIANLGLMRTAKAIDDLGPMTLAGVAVEHVTANVDPQRYVAALDGDPKSALSPAVASSLVSNGGIVVDAWIAPSDLYVRQMRVEVNNSAFTWQVTYQFSDFQK